MDGGSVSAARAVPALPVTPRCCRGAFAPGPQREEPGQGLCAPKAHQIFTVWPFTAGLGPLLKPPHLLFILSLSCGFSLQAGERIHGWKALWKLESPLGSVLSGRDLGLGSWVFLNWRFRMSQVEVIERPLPGLCEVP